jgi:D-sedoheptulose 7-phosphate isomerase
MSFSEQFLQTTSSTIAALDHLTIESAARLLGSVRDRGGRLFTCGSGGGAGHASHAACDFRKLCDFETYCVTDNVSELTARVNDDGWDSSYSNWLRVSRLSSNDAILIFSVGGGSAEHKVSNNLIEACNLAKSVNAKIVTIVGRDGGAIGRLADNCITIPPVLSSQVTPQTEGLQAVVWHLLVSHPALAVNSAKWEGMP